MLRAIKIASMILLALLAVMVIGYGFYLGTGHRAWNAWKSEREAMGESFTWASLVPPAVPDEDNFALAPIVAGAVRGQNIDPKFSALKLPSPGVVAEGNWKEGRKADLKAYAHALGTPDLEVALAPFGSALEELDRAAQRKGCKVPADYSNFEVGGFLGFRSATRVLRLRALVRLDQGDSQGAFRDVATCVRIAEHLKSEPSLLALLLRTAVLGIAMQPVWEGLNDHRWNAEELESLQKLLGKSDLRNSACLAFEAERLQSIESLLPIVEDRSGPFPATPELIEARDKLKSSNKLFARLYRGWVYRNILELARFHTSMFIDVFPKNKRQISPWNGTPQERFKTFERRHWDLILARIAVPALMDQTARISRLQVSIEEVSIACALERFRIVNGAYPKRLEELEPSFLTKVPRDLMTGSPLHFQRTPEGSYRLWSEGWDGKDQQGTLAWTQESPPALDNLNGDWPWIAMSKN